MKSTPLILEQVDGIRSNLIKSLKGEFILQYQW